MLDLEKLCEQLVKAHGGDVAAALADFFQLLSLGDKAAHALAAKHTVLELWDALQRAAP